MNIKTIIATIAMALSLTSIATSCTSEDEAPTIDAKSLSTTQSWDRDESLISDSEFTGSVNIKFTSDFNLSELFIQSRSNNDVYTVPLIYEKNSNDDLFRVSFKPKGLEISYKTPNLAWFPTEMEGYNVTVLAGHNSEVSCKKFEGRIIGIAPKQQLQIGVDVTYKEDSITTKCRLGFIARLDGAKIIIRDQNRIIP